MTCKVQILRSRRLILIRTMNSLSDTPSLSKFASLPYRYSTLCWVLTQVEKRQPLVSKKHWLLTAWHLWPANSHRSTQCAAWRSVLKSSSRSHYSRLRLSAPPSWQIQSLSEPLTRTCLMVVCSIAPSLTSSSTISYSTVSQMQCG